MRFVHITDVHVIATENECKEIYRTECNPAAKLITAAKRIISLSPEFVAVTGDIAANGDKSYGDRMLCWYLFFKEFFVKPLEQNGITVFTIPGNHDVNKSFGLDIYRTVFGEENYYLDFDGHRLIFITPRMKGRKCRITTHLLEWFESSISGVDSAVIFSHYPLSLWKNRKKVFEILEGKNVVFLSGHLHRNSFTLISGIPEIQTAALSGSWWNRWGDEGSIRLVSINNCIESKLIPTEGWG